MTRKIFRSITPSEAARALYIDVEKLKDQPPSLVGILCEGEVRQVSVDERLHAAARKKGLKCMELEVLAAQLGETCRRENRVIVAFSESELDWFRTWANYDLGPWYRNANAIGHRWMNACHPTAPGAESLEDFERFVGFERRPYLRGGHATDWLKAAFRVADQGVRRSTRTQKRKWAWLLAYNRVDLEAAEALSVHAAAGLAARAA